MKKFLFDNKINFLFLFISFLALAAVVGMENISFQSTEWLHNGEDNSMQHTAWYFFKNDIWRFPIGSNPNYGDELGSSIVFTDSIPIFALFFKLFKFFILGNFQYFSLWYLICFYLQLFFSFKILKKFTNSDTYSFIGSIFFLIAPILLYKIHLSFSLVGQWILLFTLYLGLTTKVDETKLPWVFIIILSLLIIYTFTVMILASYFFLRIFNLKLEKESFYQLLKDFFIIVPLLLVTMYLAGYFEIRVVDSLALGFGDYKLNILNIFDPSPSGNNISFSQFLPDIKLSIGEEGEGFNYFGLGQIMMVLFAFVLFFNKNYKSNLFSIKNNKEIKLFFIISLFLTLWALSNKISFGPYTLLEIPLNKYIYGVLSIVKSTGRLFYIVNYFLLIMSIIIIYKCFSKKKSLLIISLFLIIQIADLSNGLKNYITLFTPLKERVILKDMLWDDLTKKYKIIKTTYPVAYSGWFGRFSHIMEKNKIEKTNIVKLARFNRKAAADAKYYIYNKSRNKNLASDTIYVIENLSHLKHLKHIFKNNDDVGFFYRDNIWVMVKGEKERMNDNDKKAFDQIKLKLLVINEKKVLNFDENDNYYGFGWSHNFQKPGIWSEGPVSTLLFRTEKNYGDIKLEFSCRPYITRKNSTFELDIYVNNSLNKNVKLSNKNQDETLKILIKEKLIENNEIKIDFNFKNLISPYEVLESPDSRKLGILIKNIKISPI